MVINKEDEKRLRVMVLFGGRSDARLCKIHFLRNSDIDGSRSSHRFLKLVAINSRKTSAYTPNLAKNQGAVYQRSGALFPIDP